MAGRSVSNHKTHPIPPSYSPQDVTTGQQGLQTENLSYGQQDIYAHQQRPQSRNASHRWQNGSIHPHNLESTSPSYGCPEILSRQYRLTSQNSPYDYQDVSRQHDSQLETFAYAQETVPRYEQRSELQNSCSCCCHKEVPASQRILRLEGSPYGQLTVPTNQQSSDLIPYPRPDYNDASGHQQASRSKSSLYGQPTESASQQRPDLIPDSWSHQDVSRHQKTNHHEISPKNHRDPQHQSPKHIPRATGSTFHIISINCKLSIFWKDAFEKPDILKPLFVYDLRSSPILIIRKTHCKYFTRLVCTLPQHLLHHSLLVFIFLATTSLFSRGLQLAAVHP